MSKLINENKNRENLIIDLRHSIGGSIRNCAKICNLFLPKGNIFTQEFKNKKTTFMSDENYHKFTEIFILVDQYTASSSEILAYALKTKLKNCNLIGCKTYGKTIGQDIITNKKYGFILSIDTFKWYIDDFSYDTINIVNPVNDDILQTLEQKIEKS